MTSRTDLGTYLRARRELVQPHEVGIATGDRQRRVVGLRREEVAVLAGISAEYYLRLEQGRDRNPTRQVLDSLARVLLLDGNAKTYLHGLVNSAEEADDEQSNDDDLRQAKWLIDSWPMTAALVLDAQMDILAANSLMSVLVPGFSVGQNAVRAQFLDPTLRAVYRDWKGLAARSVALLRMSTGLKPGNVRVNDLVADLSARSDHFRELWERNDVIRVHSGVHLLDHPDVGPLALYFTRLPLVGLVSETIFAYQTEPGSPSEAAFAKLSAMA